MTLFASPVSLQKMIRLQKEGLPVGQYSVCSANRFVLQATLKQAQADGSEALIEATCNQVNQFGGYTGMLPADFARFVTDITCQMEFPSQRILLGGDHLGPIPWQNEPAEVAMQKALQMVTDYVQAGFSKIHLDASVSCVDDPRALDPQVSAQRAAALCARAEAAWSGQQGKAKPVYVIGTEVPPPGGAKSEEEPLQVTDPEYARQILDLFHAVFVRQGLEAAWERVIALVVQPGVEFGDSEIHPYDREQARALSCMIEPMPGLVFEAHSTDYQLPIHLQQMVADHFAILKVGPALTFAFREAAFALAQIEQEWLAGKDVPLSHLVETAEQCMLVDPQHWQRYYAGTASEQAQARKYSLSDRIRYYWPQPDLQAALEQLLGNLSAQPAPLALLSQYLPQAYWHVREGRIPNTPQALILDHIQSYICQYAQACGWDRQLVTEGDN